MEKKLKKRYRISIQRLPLTASIDMKKEHKEFLPCMEPHGGAKKLVVEEEPVDQIDLTRRTPKRKHLKNIPNRDTCLEFCNFPLLAECTETATTLLLLVLFSQISLLLVGTVPMLPILCFTSAFPQAGSPMLNALLLAIQGPEVWEGKGWTLRRPWLVCPQLSLGETKPSLFIMDYLGGKLKDNTDKKRKFCFPFIGSSMVLMPGLPNTVAQQIVELSPMAMPIIFGRWRKENSRPLLEFKNSPFDSYDKNGLERFEEYTTYIYVQISVFLRWFCKSKKRIEHWRDSMETFRPVAHKGRFVQPKTDEKTEYLCAALALFQQYLYFASEEAKWITREEAQEIFLRYWRTVLPESAPIPIGVDEQSDNLKQAYNDPAAFYLFLTTQFLSTYCGQIILGERGGHGTMGLIRRLDETEYFITPRDNFLGVYAKWLEENHISTFDTAKAYSEAAVQRALLEAGIPLRGEKNNPVTWRYPFYGKTGDSKSKSMIECFALPIRELPEQVQSCFESLIVELSGSTGDPNQSEGSPNIIEGAESL